MAESRGPEEPGGPASRFERAVAAIDAVNAEDPNRLEFEGESEPKELLHARRATHWVRMLEPEPSEALLLAARAHHLRRWHLPRFEYPEGRAGYHAWRRELQRRHAAEAGALLESAGYTAEEASRVGELIRKRGLGRDAEVQTLEDALCLVFVETQLVDFASRHPEEKVIDIVARSLAKMSASGRAACAQVRLPPREQGLVEQAVARLGGGRDGD